MKHADDRRAVTVSREELYRQVWEMPMREIAKSYGISENAFARICNELDVPYPPSGYWEKSKQRRKNAPKLPKRKATTPATYSIAQPLHDKASFEPADRLKNPHRIVAGWIAEHAARQKRAEQESNPWMRAIFGDVEWTQSDHRRLRVIDALFKSAERQGIGVATSRGTSLQFELLGQQICFRVRQRHRQVKRRKKPEEIHSPGDSTWKYQLLPTGAMLLVFERLPAGFRREWKDLKDLPLEQQLADIISTVRASALCLGITLLLEGCQKLARRFSLSPLLCQFDKASPTRRVRL
jgi:hypothetical protein